MDYQTLHAEILLPAYAGKTDVQVADILNVRGPVDLGYRALTWKEALDAISKETVAKIVETSQTPTAQAYEAAAKFYEYAMIDAVDVAPASPCRVVIDIMATKNVIGAAEVTALQNAGHNVTQMSRAEVLGLPFVGAHHVAVARSM